MRKSSFLGLLLSLSLFGSCGSSISSDAQKVADLQCKVKELQVDVFSGDTSKQEDLKEVVAESAALVQEMNTKYASLEEKQEFQQALLKAQANCN